MTTLDQAWEQYIQNARASYKVTLSQLPVGRSDTSVRQMLAGQLALCEATHAHVGINSSGHPLFSLVRLSIISQSWGDLQRIVCEIDALFNLVRKNDLALIIDAWVALGWLVRSTLFLAAGMVDKANESGTNTLDAITRVVIRTGHLRSDLVLLMRDLGLMHV